MEDLRALTPDQPRQVDDRADVGERRDLAMQGVERLDRDATVVGDVRHRLLAPGECARDERGVVAARREPVRQVRDVECRAADVQARDHPDDLHGLNHEASRP